MSDAKPKPKTPDLELFKVKPVMPVPFGGFPLTEWPSARHVGSTCIRVGDAWHITSKLGDMRAEVPVSQAMVVYRLPSKSRP